MGNPAVATFKANNGHLEAREKDKTAQGDSRSGFVWRLLCSEFLLSFSLLLDPHKTCIIQARLSSSILLCPTCHNEYARYFAS